jgi:amidophosphoribosyltransferase
MCGIVGIARIDGEACYDVYDGLLMVQHRGQDSAGMVTFDGQTFHDRRDNGLVKDVFKSHHMKDLKGSMGLGHVRYPTAGTSSVKEAQPFFVNAPLGIYLIHNGNLTNDTILREKMQTTYYRHLQTTSDTEVLLNVFADELYHTMKENGRDDLQARIFDATARTMETVTGAYSVITLIDRIGLYAFRDPAGIRPLIMGKRVTPKGDEWMFASEDVALKALGFEVVRDVRPGEGIIITKNGEMVSHQCMPGKLMPCIFEYVYLARPDSMLNGISVYKSQLRMGKKLAVQVAAANLDIDAIIPVPDSSRPVASAIAEALDIPYREGFIKNRYVGRTFIMANQEQRKASIRRKLNPIELEFRGKNVLIVDDSIVRGNTMKRIIEMCRNVGAKKVYVASGAPAVRYPDVYGVDLPNRKDLVAHGLTTEEVAQVINADHLFYQTVEDLVAAVKEGNPEIEKFATGCFDGGYVTPEVTPEFLAFIESKGRGAKSEEGHAEPTLINL